MIELNLPNPVRDKEDFYRRRAKLEHIEQVFLSGSTGVLVSFLAALVVTSLLYPAGKQPISHDLIRSLILQSQWLSFASFPTLVLVWTGLALFISAFVQIIWQERHITSPV
jgi:hypothetical protein